MTDRRSFFSKYGFLLSLVYLTAVSMSLFVVGAISNHSLVFWYLGWNLFLAWLPLVFVLWLLHMLRHKAWSSWQGLGLSLLWLGFLPNSFYMVSDYIHLQDYQRVNIVYDTVMFSAFVLTSLLLGYTSLYLIHVQLTRHFKSRLAIWSWISAILLLCSFAIYLGRDLRLNSWDIFVAPSGLLFDVSDILLHPAQHGLAFTTTLTFFVLIASVYVVFWQFTRQMLAARKSR
jgi:uncharacterized membrane protein